MSTHSVTYVYGDDENVLCAFYKQFDGYPESYGLKLAQFLNNIRVVNGFNQNAKLFETSNGMDCLSAQIIAKFKDCVGDIYMINPNALNSSGDYYYHLYNGKIVVNDYSGTIFFGTWDEFLDFCKQFGTL